MAWDHRYRQLQKGEVILPTDECLTDDDWEVDGGRTAGTTAPDPAYTSHRWYRRLKGTLPPAPTTGDKPCASA